MFKWLLNITPLSQGIGKRFADMKNYPSLGTPTADAGLGPSLSLPATAPDWGSAPTEAGERLGSLSPSRSVPSSGLGSPRALDPLRHSSKAASVGDPSKLDPSTLGKPLHDGSPRGCGPILDTLSSPSGRQTGALPAPTAQKGLTDLSSLLPRGGGEEALCHKAPPGALSSPRARLAAAAAAYQPTFGLWSDVLLEGERV